MNCKKAPNIFTIKKLTSLLFKIIPALNLSLSQTHTEILDSHQSDENTSQNVKYMYNTKDHYLNKSYKNICCTCCPFTLTVASSEFVFVFRPSSPLRTFKLAEM